MEELTQENDGDANVLGLTTSTIYIDGFGNATRREVNGVAILGGLPSVVFKGVTVHELGHAWMTVQGITNLDKMEKEGFCELLAYIFYQHTNSTESLYHANLIKNNPDPVYGGGFRKIYQIVKTVGFKKTLNVMLLSKGLP